MSIHQPAIDIIRDARDAAQREADRLTQNVTRRMEQIADTPPDDFTPNNLTFLQRVLEEAEGKRDEAAGRAVSLTSTLTRLRAEAAGAGARS